MTSLRAAIRRARERLLEFSSAYGWAIVAVIAALALTAAIESGMGRSFLGPDGRFAWWDGDIWGRENSQRTTDAYSLTHVVRGILFFALLRLAARDLPVRRRFVLALLLESGWEILENSPLIINRYREATIALGYAGDSVLNSCSDIVMMSLGFLFAHRMRVRASVAAVVAMEIFCLLWVRDNLTLNIVMLIHPVDAIRAWQSAGQPPTVVIPAGMLSMGCDPQRDRECGEDERPQHPVSVPGFRIDRVEVTQADYAGCVAAGACTPPEGDFDPRGHPRRPVTGVTWEQARLFCLWTGGRLPTEAEWEMAARGTDGRIYPWGDEPPGCDRAHTHDCGPSPADVGERPAGASPFGVLDMAGNVDEWVEDPYRAYDSAQAGRPSTERVARGGSYDAWHSRSTARNALQPSFKDAFIGFRCASSLRHTPRAKAERASAGGT